MYFAMDLGDDCQIWGLNDAPIWVSLRMTVKLWGKPGVSVRFALKWGIYRDFSAFWGCFGHKISMVESLIYLGFGGRMLDRAWNVVVKCLLRLVMSLSITYS
ncbi:hypothetical protein SEA_DAUBENSKI_243 [Streptomyces phage Daubenski]|uniref:Uncharacterized protein n=1 Tax=Streptomyces phage Daubenski TaxID=2653725 RepID=A0A5Q2WGI4_9CAUD|nr:hypothetical protein KNU80_gp062 [Streptomyces phage Daubenski]QGH76510.1 hypothetical protein SEA_DAUBENSKI_243 [Streptomyces phage Daubenski]